MIRRILKSGIRLLGRELLSAETYKLLEHRSDELIRAGPRLREYEFLRSLPPDSVASFLRLLPQSRSQLIQDLFVLNELGFKQRGFFVEFGATNGLDLSNTWLLEKQFGWTGILAEPAKVWHADLRRNRNGSIDERCVWSKSGETLQFSETAVPELSTLQTFSEGDLHRASRVDQKQYKVKTVSLLDLLKEHNAPEEIDYLSVDTEGSEFPILAAFDFNAYCIRVIIVEHNFTPAREQIRDLLESRGFVRKMESLSFVDDWYVRDYT